MTRIFGSGTFPRSRHSLIAAVIGAAVIAGGTLLIFLPTIGFLAGATASTAGLIPFPAVSVTLVALTGGVVVVALLLAAAAQRRPAAAWALVVLAMVASLLVTAFPVIAVVVGSAERVGDVGPVIGELARRVGGSL